MLACVSGEKKNPFAALQALRNFVPPGPQQPISTEPSVPKGLPRAVVRMERKHRRGKEVTVVDHLGLPPVQLE